MHTTLQKKAPDITVSRSPNFEIHTAASCPSSKFFVRKAFLVALFKITLPPCPALIFFLGLHTTWL